MELQDDVGLPAKAINDVSISLFSSNAHVANVTSPFMLWISEISPRPRPSRPPGGCAS